MGMQDQNENKEIIGNVQKRAFWSRTTFSDRYLKKKSTT
jgi:hypothetical protein